MASFTENFERAEVALHNVNGWKNVDGDNGTNGAINLSNLLTNDEASEMSFLVQTATVGTTSSQKVEAYVTSTVQGNAQAIDIGMGGHYHATCVNRKLGIHLRMEWLANNKRVLSLHTDTRGPDAPTLANAEMLIAKTLVSEGGTVQDFRGKINEDGAVKAYQHIRLIVVEDDQGMVAKGFINNNDDDRPTIEWRLPSSWTPSNLTAETLYGYWWVSLMDTGGNARTLLVSWFNAEDYTQPEKVDVLYDPDQMRLGELLRRVKIRYGAAANTNINDDLVREYINDETEHLINSIGDQAWFLIRSTTFTLNMDSEGLQTMAADIRRVLAIFHTNQPERQVRYNFRQFDNSGDVVLHFDRNAEANGDTYRLQYVTNWKRMGDDMDPCPFPRRYAEAIVVGAMRRLAETDTLPGVQAAFEGRYTELVTQLMSDLARDSRQSRGVMKPADVSRRGSSYKYRFQWG